MMDQDVLRILFVCSMNQWRSPTAEKVYADRPLVIARSAGTNKKARRAVNSADLKWAHVVFAMEQKHRQRLLAEYPGELRHKKLYVLDIPDEYKFMDAELVEEIRASVDPLLAEFAG